MQWRNSLNCSGRARALALHHKFVLVLSIHSLVLPCAFATEPAETAAISQRKAKASSGDCLQRFTLALLSLIERAQFFPLARRKKINPEFYEALIEKFFKRHPEQEHSSFGQAVRWFQGMHIWHDEALQNPAWQYFLDRWLVGQLGYVNVEQLEIFLRDLWPGMNPGQQLKALRELDKIIAKSPVLKIDMPGPREASFLKAYGIEMKDLERFNTFWKSMNKEQRRLFLWLALAKHMPDAILDMGGLPYHKGIHLEDSYLTGEERARALVPEERSSDSTQALVSKNAEQPASLPSSLIAVDQQLESAAIDRIKTRNNAPEKARLALEHLESGKLKPEVALDYALDLIRLSDNNWDSLELPIKLLVAALRRASGITPEQLEELIDTYDKISHYVVYADSENTKEHQFRGFSEKELNKRLDRKGNFNTRSHYNPKLKRSNIAITCSLSGIAGGFGLLLTSLVTHCPPIGWAGVSLMAGSLSTLPVSIAMDTQIGRMHPWSYAVLMAVDKLPASKPPSPELFHKLVATMKAPAEVYELRYRLAERYSHVYPKPTSMEELNDLSFWERRKFLKNFSKNFDPKGESSDKLLPARASPDSGSDDQ